MPARPLVRLRTSVPMPLRHMVHSFVRADHRCHVPTAGMIRPRVSSARS
jgi:hypothetical protein